MILAIHGALILSLILRRYYVSALTAPSRELFDEELSIRPLRDGKVATRFSFTTSIEGTAPRDPETLGGEDEGTTLLLVNACRRSNEETAQHYTVFPLALGQVLREHAVTELHLTLNAGNWHYDRWGYPEVAGAGSGAELWAWMGESSNPRCVAILRSELIVLTGTQFLDRRAMERPPKFSRRTLLRLSRLSR